MKLLGSDLLLGKPAEGNHLEPASESHVERFQVRDRVGQLIAEFEKDMERVSSLTKDYDSFRRLSFQNSGEISSEIYAEWGRGCLDDIRKIFLKWKNKRN